MGSYPNFYNKVWYLKRYCYTKKYTSAHNLIGINAALTEPCSLNLSIELSICFNTATI